MWGLLHDASEAYLTDLCRPLKLHSEMGTHYRVIEAKVQAAICEAFGLSPTEPPSVKIADQRMLATEKRDLIGPSPVDWGLTHEPYDDVSMESPMTPREAKMAFLRRFVELQGVGK